MKSAPVVVALIVGAAFNGAACGGSTPATTACDPLASNEASIALTGLVAAGRHADGVVYAVDEPSTGTYRVFSSEGTDLFRRRVAGMGFDNTTGQQALTFSIQEPSPFTLKIERPAGAQIRMGVYRGTFSGKTFTIGAQGDELTVDSSATQGLTVHNLPGAIAVEYAADTSDARRLVVTRPTDDWSYDDFRVFFGAADRMEERKVLGVVRATDGGTTMIRFVLDGENALAYFPSPLHADSSAYLEIGSARQDLTTEVAWAAASLQYLCL